jgi:hypothetical protein
MGATPYHPHSALDAAEAWLRCPCDGCLWAWLETLCLSQPLWLVRPWWHDDWSDTNAVPHNAAQSCADQIGPGRVRALFCEAEIEPVGPSRSP